MSQIKNDNILNRSPKDLDDRLGFWLNGAWVLFNSPEQALSNPDVINYRYIGMTIPIFDGGTSQVEYWFFGGIADENFVLKSSSGGVVTTSGEIALGELRLIIDWENGIVPGDTVTWLEKHGLLKDVVIQTERPYPNLPFITQEEIDADSLPEALLEEVFYQPSLDYYKSTDFKWLVLDNGGDNMRWLVLSKGTGDTPIPPTPGFWNDSETWIDTETWED